MPHVTVISLDSSAALQLGWVLDVLAEANRISGTARFTWDVLSFADYLGELRRERTQSSRALVEPRAAVFIAGDRLHLGLDDLDRERLRRSVRQLRLALACGPAVELFASCSLLQGHTAAACRMTSLWLGEQFPDVSFRVQPLCWNGKIGTSTGGVAIAAAVLELMSRLDLSRLALEIQGRLLLPSLNSEQSGLSPRIRFGARSRKIIKAIAFMQDNIESPISVSVVASHVGSSVRQLERLFKIQIETTPARFLKRLRLERARELLMNTELSIIETVCAAGFKNQSHFSRCFRFAFSEAPTKWREKICREVLTSASRRNAVGAVAPALHFESPMTAVARRVYSTHRIKFNASLTRDFYIDIECCDDSRE